MLWWLAACVAVFDAVLLVKSGHTPGVIIGAGLVAGLASLIEVDVLLHHDLAEGNIANRATRGGRMLVALILALSLGGALLAEVVGGGHEIMCAVFGVLGIASARALAQNSPRRIGTLTVVAAACTAVVGTLEASMLNVDASNHLLFAMFRVAFGLAIIVGLWSSSRWHRRAPTIAGPVARVRR